MLGREDAWVWKPYPIRSFSEIFIYDNLLALTSLGKVGMKGYCGSLLGIRRVGDFLIL